MSGEQTRERPSDTCLLHTYRTTLQLKGATMKTTFRSILALIVTVAILVVTSTRLPADTGTCGGAMTTLPFTDVAGNFFFCQIAVALASLDAIGCKISGRQ